MKRFGLIALLCALLLCTACAGTVSFQEYPVKATLSPSSGLKHWSSPEFDFSFSYDHTWYAVDSTMAVVTLAAPLQDATPGFREYIAFGAFINTENKTAAEIADEGFTDMQALFPLLTLHESRSVTLSDTPAELRVFGGEVADDAIGAPGRYLWHQYTWLTADVAYSITFSCSETMLEAYLPELELVLSTLVIEPYGN